MGNNDLIKRAEDLAHRSESKCCVTATGFLSPAEQYELAHDTLLRAYKICFRGGSADSERAMAFFLPDYMDEQELEESRYFGAIRIIAPFGMPSHRDYMGALLAMGISRDRLGDIIVNDNVAYVVCQNSVLEHLIYIDRVGRFAVKCERVELSDIPQRSICTEEHRFTVMSLRLDAVCSGLFRISRAEAARLIAAGVVSLNYSQCLKPDKELKENDIISIRGMGKGKLSEIGGSSRKGRLFIVTELYK